MQPGGRIVRCTPFWPDERSSIAAAPAASSSGPPAKQVPGGAPPALVGWLPGCMPTARRPMAGLGAMNLGAGAFKASDSTPKIVCLPSSIFQAVRSPRKRCAASEASATTTNPVASRPEGSIDIEHSSASRDYSLIRAARREASTVVHRRQQPRPIRKGHPFKYSL